MGISFLTLLYGEPVLISLILKTYPLNYYVKVSVSTSLFGKDSAAVTVVDVERLGDVVTGLRDAKLDRDSLTFIYRKIKYYYFNMGSR